MPLIIAALVASFANSAAILLLPETADATRFAYAQSISTMSGLASLVAMMFLLEPMWPRRRDIAGATAATGAMLLAGSPMRLWEPCILTMLLQVATGVAVYGAIAYAFDVAGARSLVGPKIIARLRQPQWQ
jgi:hypothetical protein